MGFVWGFFSAQQEIRYSKICISLQQNSQKYFHKRSFLLKGEVVAQSLPSVKPLGKFLKKVWKACILIYCISILCSEMFRGKFPWSPALMCFSSSVCAEAELMIPTRSACLPLSVLKYFLYIFFSQGRNFSCSFMTPDYWSNSVCNAVLEPFNQNRDICVAPTETNRKFSSLEFPLISDCEESESLTLWNQQGNTVDTMQLPVVSLLSFISPSLCLFQIIAYFIMSQFKFQALWLKTVSLFEFLKFTDFGTQKPVRRGQLRKLRTTV